MIKKSLLLVASLSVLSMPVYANWWDDAEAPSQSYSAQETTSPAKQEAAAEVVAPTPAPATPAPAKAKAGGGGAEPECD